MVRGKSTLRVGCGPEIYDDIEALGKLISLTAGDVIILPAGVAHCSIDNDPEYLYIGAYPLVSLIYPCYLGRNTLADFLKGCSTVEE